MPGPLGLYEGQLAEITGLALEATLAKRYGGGKKPFSGLLSSTTDIVPAAGKQIRLSWVAFIPKSSNTIDNLVQIGFVGAGLGTLYTGYALAHWEQFTGAVDQALRITLENGQPVAVTVHYEEITP